MKCLVTGGAGFIGSHVVDRLLKDGLEVVVLDDFSFGKKENISDHKNNSNLIVLNGSVCDNLAEIFRNYNFDVVFHLAALSRVQFSINNPVLTNKVNVGGTLNLLDYCVKNNVKRFVFSSSSSIYGDQDSLPHVETMKPNPMSPYALQKLIGEQYCELFKEPPYNLETVSLRYFNVYGPRQNPDGDYACLIPKFIQMLNENQSPIINGDGVQTRDFIFIDDVVEANISASKTNNKLCFGETFNIGSGRNISVNDVGDRIIKLSRKDIQPIHGPSVIEPKNTLADIEKAKYLLNWSPRVSFDEGFKKTFDYFVN